MKHVKFVLMFLFAGALNTQCTKAIIDPGSTGNTSDTITYTKNVAPIMFNYCTTCHAGGAPSAGLDLSSYTNVKNSVQSGALIDRINNEANPMPANGLLPLTTRQLIDKWVSGGYLE